MRRSIDHAVSYLVGQLNSEQSSFVLGDEIEGQKPLTQTDMAVVQNRPSRDGSLTVAVGTLVQVVGQTAPMFVSAFWADKTVRSALCSLIVPAALLLLEKKIENYLAIRTRNKNSGTVMEATQTLRFLDTTHFLPFWYHVFILHHCVVPFAGLWYGLLKETTTL